MRFGLSCELRNPAQWRRTTAAVYEDVIEHLVAAEAIGFDAADFVEHHFVDDGYNPSPLLAAAAVASRTKRMRVATNIALLPLYDPVRFAEDTVVLDAISGGRLDVGVGLGYRPIEFTGYRIDLKTRASRADEAIQIVRRLWRDDAVTFHGRHFHLDGVRVTPRPTQQPNPPLFIGGFSAAGIRRAARYGDGYTGLGDKAGYDAYLAELLALGKDPTQARVRGVHPGSLVVSEDPERTFARLEPYVTYWANSYAKWFEGTGTKVWSVINSAEELKATKLLNVMTPPEAVKMFNAMSASMTLETFSFSIAPPGFPVSDMFEYIELFAKQVIPFVNPPGVCS
jgi:alkanesulfonate monooxygenase SsuD/methylene tetrahydromethanopterin reductase-like flavin-dependent oxidoreductase (luciferase family)